MLGKHKRISCNAVTLLLGKIVKKMMQGGSLDSSGSANISAFMAGLLSNKFLCSFVLTQKNQKVKKEKIYSTFLSFALIGLSLYCDFSI